MSALAEIKELTARIDKLKAKASAEGEHTHRSAAAVVDKLVNELTTRKHERVGIQRETRAYPLWKPLGQEDFEHYHWGVSGIESKVREKMALEGMDAAVLKAIDSTGVAPLIRQDLDPEIYEVYVKNFPLYDMVEKIPSNGLVHAWNQETAYGDAQFLTETGAVTDDAVTYGRLTSNIAVLATRRGISLKAKFAVRAGGMNYDPEMREIQGGIRAIAHKFQKAMLAYTDTYSGSTGLTDPNGFYDANSFNGLRWFLQNVAPASLSQAVNVTTWPPTVGTRPVTRAVELASNAILDAGGTPSAIIASVSGRQYLIDENMQIQRFTDDNRMEVIPGYMVPKVVAGESELPIIVPKGTDAVGTYTTGGSTSFTDLFVVDMEQLAIAYLGGPSPTVLDIPTGTDGTLRHLYIPFYMAGFVPYVPQFLGRTALQTHA